MEAPRYVPAVPAPGSPVALRRLGLLAALWLAIGLQACGGSPSSASGTAALGEEFRIAPGESRLVAGSLDVRFEGVTNDSRCAVDVVCVRAGDATVHVAVKTGPGDGPERQFELHSGDQQPHQVDLGGGRSLELLALEPLPRTTQSIAPADYRATFRVSAR